VKTSLSTILFCLLLLLSACERRSEKPSPAVNASPQPQTAVAAKTALLLQEPIECELGELPVDALPVWRRHAASRPTLVLLSNDPFLQPIPPPLQAIARELVLNGSAQSLQQKSGTRSSDPLLQPLMAVSAAIDADLFAKIVWVLPANPDATNISLATFKQQLLDYGGVTASEAESFVLTAENAFAGKVRGVPLVATFPTNLSKLDGPVLVHVDISFFSPFYKNEIKTPLFPIVYSSLDALRQLAYPALAVTISTSNESGLLPVETRFLGNVVQRLFLEPSLLDQGLPENWGRKKDILYLENLFQPERMLENALLMVKNAPNDADAHYALYQAYRDNKDGNKALESLMQTVKLDRGYALEYFSLALLAQEKKRPDQAVRMLELAAAAFPENPFIPLELAKAHLHIGQSDKALSLIRKLQQVSWSAVYYPTMREDLGNFSLQLETSKSSTTPH
jgi:hypothetical protein